MFYLNQRLIIANGQPMGLERFDGERARVIRVFDHTCADVEIDGDKDETYTILTSWLREDHVTPVPQAEQDEAELLRYHRGTLDGAPQGMYLKLFHGRADPDADMADWGVDGGFIGPLQYAHTTYLHHFRVDPVGHEDDGLELAIVGDMLRFNGAYYGDWSLFMHDGK